MESIVVFALGILLGLVIGTAFAAVVLRRSIIYNLRLLARSENMNTYNTRRDLAPRSIARMALLDAADFVAGEDRHELR